MCCRFKVQTIEGAFSRLTYELIINGVRDEDYGTYQCIVRNQEGTTTRSIQLIREYQSLVRSFFLFFSFLSFFLSFLSFCRAFSTFRAPPPDPFSSFLRTLSFVLSYVLSIFRSLSLSLSLSTLYSLLSVVFRSVRHSLRPNPLWTRRRNANKWWNLLL